MRSFEKNQHRLEKGGILCTWTWSQAEWDDFARCLESFKPSFHEHILEAAKITAVAIVLAIVSYLFRHNPITSLFEPQSILLILLIFGSFLFLSWFCAWFSQVYFPKPRAGETPICTISQTGIRLGDRFFFWKQTGLKLSGVQIDTMPERPDCRAILIGVEWAYDLGVIVIPIPNVDAEQIDAVVNDLQSCIKNL